MSSQQKLNLRDNGREIANFKIASESIAKTDGNNIFTKRRMRAVTEF